jgi:hypothetical protein
MNWLTATIYGIAAAVALQALFALMTAHRQATLRRALDEELRRGSEAGTMTGTTTSTEPKSAA